MQVKLDDLELVKRVQNSATSPLKEVRSVSEVNVEGRRSLVELKIPGSSGNVLQDMGREPLAIELRGEVWGVDAKKTVEAIKAKVDSGKSISFTSDMMAAASISDVIAERFEVDQVAGFPSRYRYLLILREYKSGEGRGEEAQVGAEGERGEVAGEPVETPADERPAAEQEVEKQTMIDDIKGRVLDSEGKAASHVIVLVSGPEGRIRLETDAKGNYEYKDAPEGEYELTVDAPGYEGVRVQIHVVKSASKEKK